MEHADQHVVGEEGDKRSRRALVAGALGGAGAIVATRWLTDDANAANGQPILLGRKNNATRTTTVRRTGGGAVIQAQATGSGAGLVGESPNGQGVRGKASKAGTGVRALANNNSARALWATSNNGVAVLAQSRSGLALGVEGSVQFDSALNLVVPAGQISAAAPWPVGFDDPVVVLATLQSNPGNDAQIHYTETDVNNQTVRVVLSKAPTQNTLVGTFVLQPNT